MPVACVQTAQFSFHNNPKYWSDADTFRPERFLKEGGTNTPAFAPFGDVSTICISITGLYE